MKTNLITIHAHVRVPEEWDRKKCASLCGDLSGNPNIQGDTNPMQPGLIDDAIKEALDGLTAKLQSIDPAIELATNISK